MNITMRKALFSLLLIAGLQALEAQPITITPEKVRSFDSIFKVTYPSTGPGGVVLVAQNGMPVFKKAYGMASMELGVPMNTDNRLGIGSMSKQFCAVAILMLQDEGKLNIKDDIRKFFPGYDTHGRAITLEQLLSHTSGIPSYTEMYGFDTLAKHSVPISKLVSFFEKGNLVYEPGTNWSYSNSGFVLAALVVEKVSGMTFNEFLQKRIFDPLSMNETTLGSGLTIPNRTGEYAQVPRGMVNMDTQYDWYWAYGAGQIVSTVNDMLKWDEALYSGKIVKSATLELAHKSFILANGQPANYGLGWAVGDLKGKKVIQHGGAIGGFRAGGYRIPDDHIYIVMLTNTASSNTTKLGNGILSVLYDVKPLKENKKADINWKEANGVYESVNVGLRLQGNFTTKPAYFTLRADSVKHTLQRTGGPSTNLVAAGKDSLMDPTNPWVVIKMVRDDKGKVSGLTPYSLLPTYAPIRFNKKLSDEVPEIKKAMPYDSSALAKFTGVYENEFGSRSYMIIKNKALAMRDDDSGEEDPMESLGGNLFRIMGVNEELTFSTAKDGSVTGFSSYNGTRDIVMKKVVDKYGKGL
jgi:CubicO group peptidase (beta-lactamase class C family)